MPMHIFGLTQNGWGPYQGALAEHLSMVVTGATSGVAYSVSEQDGTTFSTLTPERCASGHQNPWNRGNLGNTTTFKQERPTRSSK